MTDVDTKKESSRDYWELSGLVFVTGGFRWGVAITGENVCMGRVGGADSSPDRAEALPVAKKVVSKIPDKGFILPKDTQVEKVGIMKQRGRPRKGGVISRVTKWRREKEEQGALL